MFEGRFGGVARAVVGSHASGFDVESTGVGVIGTFQDADVPPVACAAVRDLLAWRLAWAGVDPQATVTAGGREFPAVTGHRDLNATLCPGDRFHPLLGQLRADLADRLRGWQSTGGATLAVGYGDPGDVGLFCDWDGDGVPTVGVVRRGTCAAPTPPAWPT